MKTALTVWENRISPVFDSAHMLLVAEIENKKVASRRYEPFDPDLPLRLTDRLTELDVAVLICGAISELPANIIEAVGIKLIPFITGSVDKVLEAYAKGIPIIPVFLMPGCRHKRCRHAGRGKKHNAHFTQGRGVIYMPRGDKTGPQGQGPKTGKGQGRCKSGQGSRGGGQGKGRGRGGGQGRSRGGRQKVKRDGWQ